jgi:hypothetical protein
MALPFLKRLKVKAGLGPGSDCGRSKRRKFAYSEWRHDLALASLGGRG